MVSTVLFAIDLQLDYVVILVWLNFANHEQQLVSCFIHAILHLGFDIDPCNIQTADATGAPVTALVEGYLGEDDIFYAFTFEASAGAVFGIPQGEASIVAITNVDCRSNNRLRVRGSITNGGATQVEIHRNGMSLGTADAVIDVGGTSFDYDNRNVDFQCTGELTVTDITDYGPGLVGGSATVNL